MTLARAVFLALAAGALTAGCGAEASGEGQASLWVTRDRGAKVLLVRKVPAGLTALEALRREAEVETRYGGRFVAAVEGIAGSVASRRDWFYFVNGIEADRGAAEYRLHAGDVGWWDFRSWDERMHEPVVVGAFPEPFLHGYDGRRRPAAVRYRPRSYATAARAIGRLLDAASVAPLSVEAPRDANVFELRQGQPRFVASPRSASWTAGDPVRFVFVGKPRDALRLARDPGSVRFRYAVTP